MSYDAIAVPLRGFPGKPVGGSRSATASPGCSECWGGSRSATASPGCSERGGGSRSATASPGCSERGGGWGAMSGPPNFLAGELADLDVDPTVELLALVARVVAQGTVLPDGNDLDRGLRRARSEERRVGKECRSRWS